MLCWLFFFIFLFFFKFKFYPTFMKSHSEEEIALKKHIDYVLEKHNVEMNSDKAAK